MNREKDYVREVTERYEVLKACEKEIREACGIIVETFRAKGKMLTAGNGGSASDSDHISGELLKGFILPRKVKDDFAKMLKSVNKEEGEYLCGVLQEGLPCIPLTSHSAVMTATMNDNAADAVFAQQVMSMGRKGDVFFGISTSGNSRNIVLAAVTGRALGMKVITLTGRDGGKVKELSDICIVVPEKETYKIQELHLPIYHAICLEVENAFYGQ